MVCLVMIFRIIRVVKLVMMARHGIYVNIVKTAIQFKIVHFEREKRGKLQLEDLGYSQGNSLGKNVRNHIWVLTVCGYKNV